LNHVDQYFEYFYTRFEDFLKSPLLRYASFSPPIFSLCEWIIAAYRQVRFIHQDSQALPLEYFALPTFISNEVVLSVCCNCISAFWYDFLSL